MMQKGRHNGAKGDTHPYAKLDSQKVRDIRVSYANGETVASLARRYAISYMTMKAVAFGWAWKHVKSLHIK